jgi:uncharacterized protein
LKAEIESDHPDEEGRQRYDDEILRAAAFGRLPWSAPPGLDVLPAHPTAWRAGIAWRTPGCAALSDLTGLAPVHICAYTGGVSFQWDPAKARANLRKHRVDLADATAVFDDPSALTRDDPHPREERFVTLGLDALGRLLVVSWTPRGDDVRIIPARPATRAETQQYQEA